MSEKDINFMVKHSVCITLARTEEALISIIDVTILNFLDKKLLLFIMDGDLLD